MGSRYLVLSGGYDTKNVGDYAMLQLFSSLARKKGLDVKLLSRHKLDVLRDRYGADEILENFEFGNKEQSRGRFFRGFNVGDASSHLTALTDAIRQSSGLVIGGGRLLVDYVDGVMRGPLAYWSTLVTLAKFLGVPVHIYAMTFIRLKTERGATSVRFMVDSCTSVGVRDQASLDYLREIGCQNPNIYVLADPAFALEWGQSPLKGNKVAVSVRHIHADYAGLAYEQYLEKMVWVCEAIRDQGYEPFGIPHAYYGIDAPYCDDRTILKDIASRTPFEFVEEEWLDIDSYNKFYMETCGLIGIRRHSMLFAAASGVPVLGISENENAGNACKDIDADQPLALSAGRSEIQSRIEDFFKRRNAIQAQQKRAFDRVKSGLYEGYEECQIWPEGC
ncbi:polysaccharide pyruvyl transferase family protein [Kordiimonas lacus]|uniref:Polysaccharide pyruvyl transferase family protein WcaK n=1 Tax=Kordiimonas lacus TaxID=637679 RepID=A0A1G6VXL9_9PROT|nr:polysaccharide pyruvyl transferase family protein [Kordiimonas lacus]SDD58372.1 Polysaccharide pyruvyl transferase family protein WcaK [Kordiimonas lacus]